jgi:hypothetical protein
MLFRAHLNNNAIPIVAQKFMLQKRFWPAHLCGEDKKIGILIAQKKEYDNDTPHHR